MMKRFLLMLPILLGLSSCTVLDQTTQAILGIDPNTRAVLQQPEPGCRVISITDGDTLTCLYAGNRQVKVRLNQIDAPEQGQPFGTKSKQYLSDLAYGKTVLIEEGGNDKYGRLIGEVFADGQNVNLAMVRAGMAWAYIEYVTNPEYKQAQAAAQNEGLGIWSAPNPIYPSDWRKGVRVTDIKNPAVGDTVAKSRKISSQTRSRSNANMSNSASFKCGAKRLCGQMNSCAEARFYLNKCGVRSLDRDRDGIPCESLCGG